MAGERALVEIHKYRGAALQTAPVRQHALRLEYGVAVCGTDKIVTTI